MGFPRQEYWSRLLFPPPGVLPNPGIEPKSPTLAGGFCTIEPPGKPRRDALDSDKGTSIFLWWTFVFCAWAAFTFSSSQSFRTYPTQSWWMVNKGVLPRACGSSYSSLLPQKHIDRRARNDWIQIQEMIESKSFLTLPLSLLFSSPTFSLESLDTPLLSPSPVLCLSPSFSLC